MKDIKEYINEAKFNLEKQLENLAWGVLDYFNQEAVNDWDENDMKKYVNGDKEPDYKTIADEMLATVESEDHPNKKTLQFLKDYDKNKEDIDVAILRAMQQYVEYI